MALLMRYVGRTTATARLLLVSCTASVLCAAASWAADTRDTATLSVEIAAQPVAQALTELAAQTGLQIIYVSEIATTQVSKGAPRGVSAREALERVLDGTGLRFEFLNHRTLRVYADRIEGAASASVGTAVRAQSETNSGVRLAALEEVVVTARRRQEPLRDVPISAAVWTQEAMQAAGVKGIDEIASLTPGVEFDFVSRFGDYFTNIVIRGVTDMNGAATSVFLDDTPLPVARGETFFRSFPMTFDLDRVEVLRGPQGGLLGQDALGGAVRFVTNEPSLTITSGQVRTEIATTARGDASYEAGAAMGGPLVNGILGARVSGWYRSDGGYVDRVDTFTGATLDADANRSVARSFRGTLAWAPVESARLTPSLTWQSVHYHDQSVFYADLSDPGDGELLNGSQTRQPSDDELLVGSLKVSADLGRVDLIAATSYLEHDVTNVLDQSPLDYYEPLTSHATFEQTAFSHETRVSSAASAAPIGWVAGVWFSDSRIREASAIEDDAAAARLTVTDQTQLAGFGQVSLRLNTRLTATAGVRIGRAHYESVTERPPIARAEDTDTSTTPRFGLTYQSDRYGLLYATVAKGYRSGGVYAPHFGCGDAPAPYPADSLWSYEVGSKSSLLDRRLDLDTSVFHIRWSNHEPGAQANCTAYTYRPASAAVSNGFTLAARAFPSDRVRVGLAVAYTDAHYTETVRSGNAVIIRDGDAVGNLPQVPSPWNVTASIEGDFAVAGRVTATVRAEDVFHSENPGPFYTYHPASAYYSPDRKPDPSTNVLNLRAVLAWPSFDATVFVNNVLDSQPTLMLINACCEDPLFTASTFRPRTIGVSASWHF
jgi:outer membrane receptor protein involved in Fe transport